MGSEMCIRDRLLAPCILHICNLSVSLGIVPDAFKMSYVIPIPKCKNSTVTDFRPISILPVLLKVLEKIVLRMWLSPLASKVSPNQFAFLPRSGQAISAALTYIMKRVLSFLDTPGAVRLLAIDFCKAFDKIPHNSILNLSLIHI